MPRLTKMEQKVLSAARVAFKNPALTMDNIYEWCFGELDQHSDEAIARIVLGRDPMWVVVAKEHDKRRKRPKRRKKV